MGFASLEGGKLEGGLKAYMKARGGIPRLRINVASEMPVGLANKHL